MWWLYANVDGQIGNIEVADGRGHLHTQIYAHPYVVGRRVQCARRNCEFNTGGPATGVYYDIWRQGNEDCSDGDRVRDRVV